MVQQSLVRTTKKGGRKMKEFQFIHCNDCNMEYEIIWDNDNFEEPSKCAGCGKDDIEINHSGVKM
jgi:predicted Zn-ribbon and HTH transcriptional regulator